MAATKATPRAPAAPYSFHVLRPGPWRGAEDFWRRYLTSAYVWAETQGQALSHLINEAEGQYGLLLEILPFYGPGLDPQDLIV